MTRPQEMVERALVLSKADGCVAIADESSSVNLRWANNTLTTNGATRSRQLTVIATIGGATGTAAGVVSRSAVTEESVEQVVRAAEDAARGSTAAEDAQPLIIGEGAPTGWDAAPAETSVQVFSSFAPALGLAFEEARGQDRLLFGYAEHEMQTTYVGSSTGLRLRHDQPTGHVEINGKSEDYSRSAWVGTATADFSDVDVAGLNGQLAERLGWAQRRLDLAAGRYATLLPPSAVADLMIYLYWSAGARDAHEGRTVFSKPGGGTRVGERLTDVPVTLRSDPGAAGLECAPFVVARASSATSSVFDNGLPLQPTGWVVKGELDALVQTRYSAQLTGLPVTPEIDNLIMEGADGGGSLEDMIRSTNNGLLVTCLWYIREVDPQTLLLTGLTRDGVYLIDNGEVIGAVNNFRFNESPVDLLRRISEVGATTRTLPREWGDYFTRTATPTLRVEDFNMSSVSQAS
ncbi:MAG TPA: metallopeptidase TldD-related protein [Acidimicrobiales bacterium]|nr:metallopeptidase TldD-related protein [Acidimicrobiales bacterium]